MGVGLNLDNSVGNAGYGREDDCERCCARAAETRFFLLASWTWSMSVVFYDLEVAPSSQLLSSGGVKYVCSNEVIVGILDGLVLVSSCLEVYRVASVVTR